MEGLTNEQIVRQELQRRMQENAQRKGQIDQRLNQFDQVNALPEQAQGSQRAMASLVDTWTGSNLASTVRDQPQPRDLVKAQLYARMQQPKENIDGLLSMLGRQDIARTKAIESQGNGQGKELSQSTILKLNEGNTIPTMLANVESLIDNNKSAFGPVVGRSRSYNPYDEQSKGIDAEIRAKSQAFGKFMEGGVLRKEDEEKYRKMFPNLSDTPVIAKKKLAVVKDLLEKASFKHSSFQEPRLRY